MSVSAEYSVALVTAASSVGHINWHDAVSANCTGGVMTPPSLGNIEHCSLIGVGGGDGRIPLGVLADKQQ
jgi:hypothetical protein